MIKSAEQDSGLYTFAMLGFGVYRFHSFDTAMRFLFDWVKKKVMLWQKN